MESGTESVWQHEYKHQIDRLWHLIVEQMFTDCSFVFEDPEGNKKIVLAHKLILVAASPVFQQMFYGPMAEKDGTIVITDINVITFQNMIEFIYTDCINFDTVEMACQLYYAAKKYMLKHLMEACVIFLSANVNLQTFSQIYEFSEFYDEPSLKKECSEFLIADAKEVLTDPNFTDIKMSTMLFILDHDKLKHVTELDLFNALERLATKKGLLQNKATQNAEQTNDMLLLKKAIKKIRFLTMTPETFANGPAHSKLLEKQETLAILIKLSSPYNQNYKLPEGFTDSLTKRTMIFLTRPSRYCYA
ncbi:BTB/POZ domain-containing protein 6-like [Lucilia sericata]|uniref:BTB/POZ domain-containing protein 6-like n=1 Tax=Lucilia sericata TaxID=13632 RepID=UPI0018A80A3D|nr:BTB/POZ domain-containing protein 6-like [Lucilia sericata]